MQALTNASQKRPICDPNCEHLLELGAIHTVEEGDDVGLEAPPYLAPVHDLRPGAHSVVGTAPRPKPIRAASKVLLVDGCEYLAHGSLDHFVLEGRNPNRPRLALGLWDVPPSDRLVAIALRLQPRLHVPQVALQGLPLLRLRDAIAPHRRIGTLAAIGSFQGWPIDQVCQRVEPSCEFALRSLPYLQKSW